ncbi:hypothetical protein [Agromyces bauzanensis]
MTIADFQPEPSRYRRVMDSILHKSVQSRAPKVDANGKPDDSTIVYTYDNHGRLVNIVKPTPND